MRPSRPSFLALTAAALFAAGAASASEPPPLPFVHEIGTEPAAPCAGRPVTLILKGVFNDGCGRVVDARTLDSGRVEVTLKVGVLPDTVCTGALEPWRLGIPLGPLAAGRHRTAITVHLIRPDSTGTALERRTYHSWHDFAVATVCPPAPPPGPLPYVESIVIGRPTPCGPVPPCAGDSIRVRVSGTFPDNCRHLRRVELVPTVSTTLGPPPPPTVRLIVDNGCCLGRPCAMVLVPWSATVVLPPLPAGDHRLPVEVAEVCCADSFPPGTLHGTSVPFRVAERCEPAAACLVPAFAPGDGGPDGCDAFVGADHPAELTFRVRPNVALAGLQGEFRVDPPGLRIVRLEPVGPAAGKLLDWVETLNGVRFALFATTGAVIPPFPGDHPWSSREGWPVLRVVLEHDSTAGPLPARSVVQAERLLGADATGGAVPVCPPPPCVQVDPRFAPGRAIVCTELPCDVNADGRADIRDIVLLVRCLTGELPCPPDPGTRLDCDGDGGFALADVLCCARHVLRRVPCPDCPPDSGEVRPEPAVGVSFGAPSAVPGGVTLPIEVAGWDRVGGMLLTLEAPLDRYDVAGLAANTPWLALHEVRDGRLVLGLLDLHDRRSLALRTPPELALTLRLRPGQPPGGELAVVEGEFSGPDGVALDVALGRPARSLPGGAPLRLGPGRPNPFSTTTSFTLDLDRDARVEVAIYDLRGRAVATLHRGPLAAGTHAFPWDGRRGDGSAATDGIYFCQATVDGRTLTRKLIRMRGE